MSCDSYSHPLYFHALLDIVEGWFEHHPVIQKITFEPEGLQLVGEKAQRKENKGVITSPGVYENILPIVYYLHVDLLEMMIQDFSVRVVVPCILPNIIIQDQNPSCLNKKNILGNFSDIPLLFVASFVIQI